jgi:hypothetical protein
MNLQELPDGFRQPSTVEDLMVSKVAQGVKLTLDASIKQMLLLKRPLVRTFLWDGRIKRSVIGVRLVSGAYFGSIVEEYDEFERCSKAEDWDMDLQEIVDIKSIVLEYTEPSIHFCFPHDWLVQKTFPRAGDEFVVVPGQVLIPSKESVVSAGGVVLDQVLYDIRNQTSIRAENDCRICILTKR